MNQLNEGRQHEGDPPGALRTAALVEATDVGSTLEQYLGQQDYTFEQKDVGRLIEVVQDMSPGYFSWRFGSSFEDLRLKYPDPYPYVVEM